MCLTSAFQVLFQCKIQVFLIKLYNEIILKSKINELCYVHFTQPICVPDNKYEVCDTCLISAASSALGPAPWCLRRPFYFWVIIFCFKCCFCAIMELKELNYGAGFYDHKSLKVNTIKDCLRKKPFLRIEKTGRPETEIVSEKMQKLTNE